MSTGNTSPPREAGTIAGLVPALLIGAIALGILLREAFRYRGFYSDDSLISLRYAERLIAGRGLTWNDGEFVEGYSNLSWILASSLLGALGLDLQDATRVLGVLGTGGAIAAGVWLHRPSRWSESLPAIVAGLGMALTGTFAIWTVGGLEQPMVVCLLAWAAVLSVRALESGGGVGDPAFEPRTLLPAGVLLGLLCPTRPDGPIFVAAACLGVVWAGGLRARAWQAALWLAAPGLLLFAAQLGFRLFYYDAWVPNTAHAKLSLSAHRMQQGLSYLWRGVWPMWPIALPTLAAVLAAIRLPALRLRVMLLLPPLLAWCVWVVAIGGDIFPGRRHLITVVLGFALLAAEGWRAALAHSRGPWRAGVWITALLSLVLLADAQRTRDVAHTRALFEVPWAMGGEALGRLLGEAFETEQPLIAVTAAGSLPYYSKLPALDMLGLNDRYLAEHPPADLGRGRIGHELGDGAYFLRRAPDIVVFCGTTGGVKACSRGGREMQQSNDFARLYSPVSIATEHPIATTANVFVRTDSERIGVRREAGGDPVIVPGLLFSAFDGATAAQDESGSLGVRIDPDAKPAFSGLRLRPGDWRVRGEGHGQIEATLALAPGEMRTRPTDRLQISGNSPAPVVIRLSTIDESALALRVVLERRRSP